MREAVAGMEGDEDMNTGLGLPKMCEGDKSLLMIIATCSKLNERNKHEVLGFARGLEREEKEEEKMECGMRECRRLSGSRNSRAVSRS